MAKQSYTPGYSRQKNAGSLGRAEQLPDEDRPFAEIRRNIHHALLLLSLHRWAFFVPCSVVTCAAFILSLYYPRTYSATTTFERRNDPVMMNLPMSAGAASFKYFRNTMVRDLTSIDTLAEVVEKLGLIKGLERNADGTPTKASQRQRDGLARALAAKLSVSTVSPSEHIDVIRITYTGPDPTIGKALVDAVKRSYIRRTMTWIHNFLTSQRDYFSREAEEALEEVKEVQREETRLRLENPHFDPVNPGNITLRLTQLEMEQRELLRRKREYEAELAAQQQMLASVEPKDVAEPAETRVGPMPDEAWISPQALMLGAEIKKIDDRIQQFKATRGMTDLHPEIQTLYADRRRMEAELAPQRLGGGASSPQQSGATPANPPVGTVVAAQPWHGDRARVLTQVAAQQAKLKDVDISLQTNKEAIEQLEQAKQGIYQKQEEFAVTMGAVAKAKQKYGQLAGTVASIEPAIKAVEQDRLLQFSEEQPASGSSIPISPKAATIVLLAILAGLATGVVFVVLAEVFDHVLRSSGQVAHGLGLPMLESIDEIITSPDRRYLFVRNAVVTPLVIVCFIGLAGLTGSMAYLSIEQPWAYQKIKRIPEAAWHLFVADSSTAEASGGPGPSDLGD